MNSEDIRETPTAVDAPEEPKQETPVTDMPVEEIDMAEEVKKLELGKIYTFHLIGEIVKQDGKTETRRAVLGNYKFETRTETCDAEILHRFQAMFNQTLLFLDRNGIPRGDFEGWKVERVELAEPVFVKHVQMIESQLVQKATDEFGEDAPRVIEFLKNL